MEQYYQKYKNLIVLVAAILIALFCFKQTSAFYKAQEQKNLERLEDLMKVEELALKLKTKNRKVKELRERFLPPDTYSFMSSVGDIAAKAGLKIDSIKDDTRPGRDEDLVTAMVVNLRVSGTYESLCEFISKLESSNSLSHIESVKASGEKILQSDLTILGLAILEE